MKKQNYVNYAAVCMLLAGICSCSSSDDAPSIVSNPTLTGVNVDVQSAAQLAARVTNLKGSATRATADVSAEKEYNDAISALGSMEAFSKLTFADTKQFDEVFPDGKAATTGATAVINTNAKRSLSLDLNGNTVVVKGTLTLKGLTGAGTIYVAPTGKLIIDHAASTDSKATVYNYGTLTTTQSKFEIAKGETLYNWGMFDLDGKTLENDGRLYVSTYLRGGDVTLGEGSVTNVAGDLKLGIKSDSYGTEDKYPVDFDATADHFANLTVKGTLHTGKLIANNVELAGEDALVAVDNYMYAKTAFTTNATSNKVFANYVHVGDALKGDGNKNSHQTVGDLVFNKPTAFYLGDGGKVVAFNLKDNAGANGYFELKSGKGGTAVVKVQNLYWPESGAVKLVKTPEDKSLFGVEFLNCYLNGTSTEFDDVAFDGGTVRKIKQGVEYSDLFIPADKWNNGGYNPDQKGSTTTAYKTLDLISEVDYGDHSNSGLSATCVQPYNGKMYVSYHTNGTTQNGCLEVLQTTGDKTTLLQSVASKGTKLEYNHLAVDAQGKRILAVGNSAKGGIMAYIGLDDNGLMNTKSTTVEDSTFLPLNYVTFEDQNTTHVGGDGNAVIRNGQYIEVATTQGFMTFDANDFSQLATRTTTGRAKHIATDGNVVIGSYYTKASSALKDANTAAPLSISVYPLDNYTFTKPTLTFAAGDVTPNNGKNVIAKDGDNIYACMGKDGLKVFNNGTLSWSFKPADAEYTVQTQDTGEKYPVGTVITRGNCNGVTFDNNYIYLAYGGLGCIVVDKTTHQEVCRYNGGKSANYVALDNGYVYVANGQNNLKVLKVTDRNVQY